MTTTTATGQEGQPAHGGTVVRWLGKAFEVNPAGINWPRAALFLDIALVPLVVLVAIGYEQYLLTALFAVSSRGRPTLEAITAPAPGTSPSMG